MFVLVVLGVVSHDVVRGLMEAQEEEVSEEGIQYVAMRNLFVREAKEAVGVKVERKTRTTRMRESAERVELSKTVAIPHYLPNRAGTLALNWSLSLSRWTNGLSSAEK